MKTYFDIARINLRFIEQPNVNLMERKAFARCMEAYLREIEEVSEERDSETARAALQVQKLRERIRELELIHCDGSGKVKA